MCDLKRYIAEGHANLPPLAEDNDVDRGKLVCRRWDLIFAMTTTWGIRNSCSLGTTTKIAVTWLNLESQSLVFNLRVTFNIGLHVFSRVHATLRVTVSVRRSVCRSVGPALLFFCVVTCSVACARLMAIGLVFNCPLITCIYSSSLFKLYSWLKIEIR